MGLSTGKKITPNRVFEIPVTNTVIKHVEAMAEAQGIKSLKLTGTGSRLGSILSTGLQEWTAIQKIQKHTKMKRMKTTNMRTLIKTHGSILMKTGCPQKEKINGGQILKPGQTIQTQTLSLNGTATLIPLTRAKSMIYSTRKIPILSSQEPVSYTHLTLPTNREV